MWSRERSKTGKGMTVVPPDLVFPSPGEHIECTMILEGIVTTIAPTGEINIAPMGPRVDGAMEHFLLRPFPTSQTYRNLKAHGEGVLHVTDDVLVLAQAALGRTPPQPCRRAER